MRTAYAPQPVKKFPGYVYDGERYLNAAQIESVEDVGGREGNHRRVTMQSGQMYHSHGAVEELMVLVAIALQKDVQSE